jgi:hypothetical protein
VIAVALILATYADPDGRHCRPAVETIVWQAGVTKRTVRTVLAWMVEHGWLEVTRRTGTSPTEYRLTIPVGADDEHLAGGAPEHQQKESPVVLTSTSGNGSAGALAGARGGALEHPDLRTSEALAEEEEEERSARSADAALATRPNGSVDIKAITSVIGAATGRPIGSSNLTAALLKAKSVTGWSDVALAAYCIEKLRGHDVRDLSAWLTTDLKRLDANTVSSPFMAVAELLTDLAALDQGWRQQQHDQGVHEPDHAASPLGCFKKRLYETNAMQDYREVPPWWKVTQINEVTAAAQAMLSDPRYSESPPYINPKENKHDT